MRFPFTPEARGQFRAIDREAALRMLETIARSLGANRAGAVDCKSLERSYTYFPGRNSRPPPAVFHSIGSVRA